MLTLTACAAPAAKAPAAAAPTQKEVKTAVRAKASAYSSGAACNGQWARRNAIGKPLRSGAVNSAAADWSRYPVGTKFRVKETGKVYQVDDYGSAMVGRNKVDLYTPSQASMNRWGVRDVTLEILEWGCPEKSLAILQPRARRGYIREMVSRLRTQLGDPRNQG